MEVELKKAQAELAKKQHMLLEEVRKVEMLEKKYVEVRR